MDLLYAKWYSMSTYLVLKTRLYIYDNLFWIEKAEAFIFFNLRVNNLCAKDCFIYGLI